jgi:sugar (pentulose or hexulose) kinase
MAVNSPPSADRVVAVLDIGKTNLKILIATADGAPVEAVSRPHDFLRSEPYPSIDIDGIIAWLVDSLGELATRHRVDAIVTTAHGCAAVLTDADGPVLPMMDYEAPSPPDVDALYATLAPPFDEVFCPTAPGAMQLGKQLVWQRRLFPREFARATHHLTTAQYVAWRLCGRAASEVSQVAAQGHLFDPRAGRFSSLVTGQGFARLYPPFAKAGEALGRLLPAIAARTGLAADTAVLCGVHDSNANLFRYKAAGLSDRTILSTGTWMIGFDRRCPFERLDGARGMVSNVDVDGAPIASTLTMTGREHALIAAGAVADNDAIEAALPDLVARGTLALPSFVEQDGLFPGSGRRGRIVGPLPRSDAERRALAALYAALTAAGCLDALGSRAPIVVDGGFASNRAFGRLLAALRPGEPVAMSRSSDGTALGAALLWQRFSRREPVDTVALDPVAPLPLAGLAEAAARWRALSSKSGAAAPVA